MPAADASALHWRTLRSVVLVSHGAPSAPETQERWIAGLASRVGEHLPGCTVRGATLAAPGALASALRGLERPLIYPMFMSDGWFVSTHLPKRVAKTGADEAEFLPPFGLEPATRALCTEAALRHAAAMGVQVRELGILLAAHGSPNDRRAGQAAEAAAGAMRATGCFREVRTGFVDEDPRIEEAARMPGPALCVPFFASRAGHVLHDLPEGLAEGGFPGPCLDPLGVMPEAPAIVAGAIEREALQRA